MTDTKKTASKRAKTARGSKSPAHKTSNVLVIDVGGTNIKLLATGHTAPTKIPSGPAMTPQAMVDAVKAATTGWTYEKIAIGYPGVVVDGRPLLDPANLAKGWVRFDYAKALGHPVRVINDAAMQALGSYEGGRMLFLGLGTGLGSAMIVEGQLQPLELAHMPYKDGLTYEDFVGKRGLEKYGKKKWRKLVFEIVDQLRHALEAGYVVLGGGNLKLLKELPPGCLAGNNANAFEGGFRLWGKPIPAKAPSQPGAQGQSS
jgi:predicted NBD/HSP70 family sugar kinase